VQPLGKAGGRAHSVNYEKRGKSRIGRRGKKKETKNDQIDASSILNEGTGLVINLYRSLTAKKVIYAMKGKGRGKDGEPTQGQKKEKNYARERATGTSTTLIVAMTLALGLIS